MTADCYQLDLNFTYCLCSKLRIFGKTECKKDI